MSWINMVSQEEATGDLADFYKTYTAKTGGELDHVLQVQSLMPEAMQAFYETYLELMWKPGPLDRRERELIAVTVSSLNDCHY